MAARKPPRKSTPKSKAKSTAKPKEKSAAKSAAKDKPKPKAKPSAADYVRERQARDMPPANPLFDDMTKRADRDLQRSLENFRSILKSRPADGNKTEVPFLPFLLVRQTVGDHGQRPIATPPVTIYGMMPDIWVFKGDPATAPQIPPGPGFETGGVMELNTKYTVYAHVWNLGRAPIAGVRVDFFWFDFDQGAGDPTNPVNQSRIHTLGTARVNLQPRSSLECHQLVKCPAPLVRQRAQSSVTGNPALSPSYKFSLLVQVSSLGDPVSAPYHPLTDRHVGRRDFSYWVQASSGGGASY